jgi:hypothetical protein
MLDQQARPLALILLLIEIGSRQPAALSTMTLDRPVCSQNWIAVWRKSATYVAFRRTLIDSYNTYDELLWFSQIRIFAVVRNNAYCRKVDGLPGPR